MKVSPFTFYKEGLIIKFEIPNSKTALIDGFTNVTLFYSVELCFIILVFPPKPSHKFLVNNFVRSLRTVISHNGITKATATYLIRVLLSA